MKQPETNRRGFLSSLPLIFFPKISASQEKLTAEIRYTPSYKEEYGLGRIWDVIEGIEVVFSQETDTYSIMVKGTADYYPSQNAQMVYDMRKNENHSADVDVILHYWDSDSEFDGYGGNGVAVLDTPANSIMNSYLAAHETGHAIGYRHHQGTKEVTGNSVTISTMYPLRELEEDYAIVWNQKVP